MDTHRYIASAKAFEKIGDYYENLGYENWEAGMSNGGSINHLIDFGGNLLTPAQVAGQIAAHAVTGGVLSYVGGGKFGHGFFSAGVTKGLGTPLISAGNDSLIFELTAHMLIGGTASAISGGKFSNGARTAAYQLIFNGWGSKLVKVAIRNVWKPTPSGTIKVMRHGRFGKFYKHKSDNSWWSSDIDEHGKSYWKVFKEESNGLRWVSDADEYGQFIDDKHKGPTGKFIPWKELNAVNGWQKGIDIAIIVGITVMEVVDPTTYLMSGNSDPMDRLPNTNNGGGG